MKSLQLHKLLKNLKEEHKRQEMLLGLLTHERASIVKMQQDELDQVILKKEELLKSIQANKDEREALFAVHLSETNGARKDLSLEPIVSSIADQRLKAEFESITQALGATMEAVVSLNTENAKILKQSLGLVASTLAIMRSKPQTNHSAYSRKGKVEDESENLSQLSPVSSFSKSV